VHSRTRSSFLSESPKAKYTGIVSLGGIASTQLPATGRTTHMIFGRRGFFGYAVPRPGETWWFSNIPEREEPPRGSLDEIEPVRWRDRLLEVHQGDPAEVVHILRSVTGDVGAYAVSEIDPLPHWHRGLVCLIGDAAHAVGPHVGQGAALALEDGFELARCLRDLRDPVAAFSAFEDLRRERVQRVLRLSHRMVRRKVPRGTVGRTLRDLILPPFLRRGVRATEWMYAYRPAWHDRVRPRRRRQWWRPA
jgi:2-polyprenyl-6-methoxyphenol hydroxylase-like FAD-dependent oxidoreductase